MSSVIELPKVDDLSNEQWEQLSKQFEMMQQQVALKQKRSSKLDEAMSEASVRAPAAKAVDACFVIDCTYSMRNIIQAAKQNVSEIQRRICSLLGHGGNVRFAIVAYRDHQFDTNIEVLPFTKDLHEVSSFLSALEAGGTFRADLDECEDVIGGLSEAMKLQWQAKTRILYLLCDCPPHGQRFTDGSVKESCERQFSTAYDFSPEDPNQWQLTDSVMGKSVEFQLNLVVLKFRQSIPLCAKMFDVFAELRKDSGDSSKQLQTLAFESGVSADDLVSCIQKGTTKTLSLTRGSAAMSSGRDPGGERLTFSVKVAICWADRNCLLWKSWPLHDAFVTHLRVVGLTSDPQRNTVVRKLHIRPEPFAEGAMRYAFPATTEDGKRFVLKVHKVGVLEAEKECLADVQTQAYAKFFGEAFAQRFPDAPIQFLESWQVELLGCPIGRHATLEPFLEGKYQKFTNNSGFVAEGAKLAEAFSHFTFCHSGGQMMVTDLQGFESSILTDPQIHCFNKDLFGRGNLGSAGMDQCFLGHTCNEICAALKLKPHPMQLALDDEETSAGSGSSTPSSTHGSQICELCGALFKLRQQEYLDTINKYQAVLCAECGAKVDANKLSVPCGSCSKEVYFSPYAIAIKGCAKPEKCRDCELSEEWMFVDE